MRYCKDITAGGLTLGICMALTIALGLVGRGVAAEATISVEGNFVAFDPALHCEVVPDHPDCAVFKALVEDITGEVQKNMTITPSPDRAGALSDLAENRGYSYEVAPDGSLTLVY